MCQRAAHKPPSFGAASIHESMQESPESGVSAGFARVLSIRGVRMSLAIAILALVIAGYAAYLARWTRAAVVELIDAQAAEEVEDEEGAQELWLSEGEFYSADKAALEAAFPGALAFVQCEGVPSAVMPNGVWSLHKLLSDKPKIAAVPK